MSSSTEVHPLFYLIDVYQVNYYNVKYLQSSTKWRKVKDKQIRDVEIDWDKYAGKGRNVEGEILHIWRWQVRRNLKVMIILIMNLNK